MSRRFVALILCVVMVILSIIPCSAGYEDGQECPSCGHYHECLVDEGVHCSACGACHCHDFENALCGDCFMCEGCAGMLCEECGFCASCWEHCELCGECLSHLGFCESGGEHCTECCVFCEECGRCITYLEEDEGMQICDYCGLCEECCLQKSEDEGCSCGLCIESDEWEDHCCENCGDLFCQVEMCDTCGLCEECCASQSECSQGMCVYDSDYDEHFCEICGTCFCEVNLCESCSDEGYLICEGCCLDLATFEGCDCGDVCVHDPDFEEHIEIEHKDHPDGKHSASGMKAWCFDENSHWHVCKFCTEEDHYTDVGGHHFNELNVCVDCGFVKGGVILIERQPKNASAQVSDVDAEDDEPLNFHNNTVSFTVKAKSVGKLTFTWYEIRDDGKYIAKIESGEKPWHIYSIDKGETLNSSVLTVSVPVDACYRSYGYYCVISDESGVSVTSSTAYINAKHVYSRYTSYGGEEKVFYGEKDNTRKYYETAGHQPMCCGDGCGKTKNDKRPHVYIADKEVKDASGNVWTFSYCELCDSVKYVPQHEHTYTMEDIINDGSSVYNSTQKRYEITLADGRKCYINSIGHAISCDFEGCNSFKQESHSWSSWQIVNPVNKKGDVGALYRECLVCGYQQTAAKDENGKQIKWQFGSHPIEVQNGKSNHSIAADGSELVITYLGNGSSKCTGWTCYYKEKPLSVEIK